VSASVSILAPVHNEERYLQQMIDSVRGQSSPDWELILVDDGSTDSTRTIIEDNMARDSRVVAASLGERLGKVDAFNRAFAAASGDIVCMLGGDDFLPSDSIAIRIGALAGKSGTAAGFFKLRMFQDGDEHGRSLVIPRNRSGSRSGPSITLNRELADLLFPIPNSLPSEDIWLGEGAYAAADYVYEGEEVVVNYRVHPQNSNPRHKSFRDMSESIHARLRAYELLAASPDLLDASEKLRMEQAWKLECMRYAGSRWRILTWPGARFVDRMANLSMSSAVLWRIRQRFFVQLTGWRGR